MKNKFYRFWMDLSISKKLTAGLLFLALAIVLSNLIMFIQLNSMTQRLDEVYSTNVNLTEVSESLDDVQEDLYRYLEVRDYDSLQEYFKAEQAYIELYSDFPTVIGSSSIQIMEKNIHNMSETYLKYADAAVTARRGNNVENYKLYYSQALKVYGYIKENIAQLNAQQFSNNTISYQLLQQSLSYLELYSIVVVIAVSFFGVLIMSRMISEIVFPLKNLSNAAMAVGEGRLEAKVEETGSRDEVGVVTHTFNNMVDSLNVYVEKVKESADQELLMETHLKEAQLRFLQAQINPHFLFNALNAGVQLSEMNDDEETSVFLERMADFFRYNVKKGLEDASLQEEITMTDNYIYIMNVRFAGEISFEKDIDENLMDYRMPGIILQPIVENAISHGIREKIGEGKVWLSVKNEDNTVCIRVRDNGIGMTQEEIDHVLSKQFTLHNDETTGIGLDNVIARLSIYFDEEAPIEIYSDGPGRGTEVVLRLPLKGE